MIFNIQIPNKISCMFKKKKKIIIIIIRIMKLEILRINYYCHFLFLVKKNCNLFYNIKTFKKLMCII